MASRRESDDISITVDEDFLTSSPRATGRAREQSQTSLQAAVKAILDGGLAAQIKTVVQQQAALVFGEMADSWDTPSSSKASAPVTMEGDHDVRKSRQAILIGGEIVDEFNPDDKDSGVDRWLSKIDQLGDIHGWAEYNRSTIMQAKLVGSARKWYHQLERYDFTWAQWKKQLRQAFPRRHDFAVMLEEMLARRKMAGESMTTYYHAKLALCGRVDVKGEKAVSCIIRGLPEELRAKAYAAGCSTPKALYHHFLAGLESYSKDPQRRRYGDDGESRAAKRPASVSRASVRCYNCQEQGNHMSRDCPRARMDRCWNWFTTAYVNGEAVRVYIDTGSEVNLMSAPTARRLGLACDVAHRGLTLSGFGGGVASSLGKVRFDLVMAELQLSTQAFVTDCDMGRIELLLGQAAIQAPGVVLVVRNNKAVLTNEGDVDEFFRRLELEASPARCRIILDEDLDLKAGESKRPKVKLVGDCGEETVVMDAKSTL